MTAVNAALKPEELEAVLAAVTPKPAAPSGSVAPRDFARPLRLSQEQREVLRECLTRALPNLERELSSVLRARAKVGLSDVDEIDAEQAVEQLRIPLAAAPFAVADQPCWIVWDNAAAVTAMELALGAPEVKASEPRKLTSVESMLFKRVAQTVLREVAPLLEIKPENLRVATLLEELGSPRDVGERFDPRRLLILLELELPTGTSTLRLYLPAPASEDALGPASGAKAALPAHLGAVPLTLSARLGAADVPLADLLALEVGDVIPLGVATSQPLEVWAEDRPWAQAHLGASAGHLALKLHSAGGSADPL